MNKWSSDNGRLTHDGINDRVSPRAIAIRAKQLEKYEHADVGFIHRNALVWMIGLKVLLVQFRMWRSLP